VSLRILFADDSVTAQNMGKKILTDAGYEVVAVSNGAAAVKKIAEQKPDIIILDVYMPGYSGLEVCEKVRGSIATIKTPVLLTVGKMEPYKAEDASRVRADGVIIKPFEATDLLAIVKKFEERIGQAAPPPLVATAPPPTEAIAVAPEPESHIEPAEPARPHVMQPMVEVPDHMATSSAFSDLLGSDQAQRMEHFSVAAPQRGLEPPAPIGQNTAAAAVQDYELPVSWRQEPQPVPASVPEPVSAAEVSLSAVTPAGEASAVRPLQIPVYQETSPSEYEMLPTAAAPTGDIEIAREPHLQETAEEETRNTVADSREPGLIASQHLQPEPHSIQASPELPPLTPEMTEISPEILETFKVAESAAAAEPSLPEAEAEATAALPTDTDFEARVAAAMAAYSHSPEQGKSEEAEAVAILPEESSSDNEALSESSVEAASGPAPSLEYQPQVDVPAAVQEDASISAAPEVGSTDVRDQIPATPSHVWEPAALKDINHDAVEASVEAEVPAAAAAVAAATGGDHETIAQAVHRVMERIKGDLVEEIVRELKTRK
jgi:CheY-like chemotaxis protein